MDDGLTFFLSCNIRAVYTRENKPRLTLVTVYKIRKRNYLYEYLFPGQYNAPINVKLLGGGGGEAGHRRGI